MTGDASNQLEQAKTAARALTTSDDRFDDSGQYRIEIPSVEGPDAFEAVLDAAQAYDLTIHRVSEGSGISLLTDDEIRRYASLGFERSTEVCLFVGPRAPWNASASALAPDGSVFGWRHMTVDTLAAAYDDVVRATELGIRSVLVSDEGLIVQIEHGRRTGALPADLVVKASAMLGISNALGGRLLAEAGADTLNVASDIGLGDLAAFRALTNACLDLYIEGPDGLGGFVRYHDIGEVVRLAAPVYLKFGLRNAGSIYPSGQHLHALTVNSARERVRRAAIGMEHLGRQYPTALASPRRSGRGIPRG